MRSRHESCAYRIMENIISFILNIFLSTEAMLKEIALPCNSVFSRHGPLPHADGFGEDAVRRKRNQEVDVVGHKQREVAVPELFFVIEANCVQDARAAIRMAEVILTAGQGADRYKIVGVGSDPMRRLMIEVFAGRHVNQFVVTADDLVGGILSQLFLIYKVRKGS